MAMWKWCFPINPPALPQPPLQPGHLSLNSVLHCGTHCAASWGHTLWWAWKKLPSHLKMDQDTFQPPTTHSTARNHVGNKWFQFMHTTLHRPARKCENFTGMMPYRLNHKLSSRSSFLLHIPLPLETHSVPVSEAQVIIIINQYKSTAKWKSFPISSIFLCLMFCSGKCF